MMFAMFAFSRFHPFDSPAPDVMDYVSESPSPMPSLVLHHRYVNVDIGTSMWVNRPPIFYIFFVWHIKTPSPFSSAFVFAFRPQVLFLRFLFPFHCFPITFSLRFSNLFGFAFIGSLPSISKISYASLCQACPLP